MIGSCAHCGQLEEGDVRVSVTGGYAGVASLTDGALLLMHKTNDHMLPIGAFCARCGGEVVTNVINIDAARGTKKRLQAMLDEIIELGNRPKGSLYLDRHRDGWQLMAEAGDPLTKVLKPNLMAAFLLGGLAAMKSGLQK